MAFAIDRPDTAFPLTHTRGKKRQRQEAKNHLAFIRELPCIICGEMPVHAAHIRYGDMRHGKRETGMGEKPSDCWTVPLAPRFHTDGPEAQHQGAERAFWVRHGIDPCEVATKLWAVSGDHDAARMILQAVRDRQTGMEVGR